MKPFFLPESFKLTATVNGVSYVPEWAKEAADQAIQDEGDRQAQRHQNTESGLYFKSSYRHFFYGFKAGAEWADQTPAEPINELIHQRSIAFDEAAKWKQAAERLAGALEECISEMRDAAYAIQTMKDGNYEDGEDPFGRLRALRQSFFGGRDAGLKAKTALAAFEKMRDGK